jgi:4-carboxymuconolactone decarboxylase
VSLDLPEFPILDAPLDRATVALVRLASAIALGRDVLIAERSRAAAEGDVPPIWIDELLLQSMLMVGWPRALVAAATWRRESGARAPAADRSAGEGLAEWQRRGEVTCARVYGANYQRLRENVHALHPALDWWMVTDGYGKVLSRPALDLARRELCVVAQTAVLGTERQLHSHLRGALHAGASRAAVEESLALVAADLEPALLDLARKTWGQVQRSPGD